MSQRYRLWVVGVVVVAAGALLGAAACGGASGSEDGSSASSAEAPSTTEEPTTTTTVDPQAQALADAEAAYLAYEEASNVAAADPVDPQHPELQALITGDQRIHTNSELGGFLADGEAARPAEPSQYQVNIMSATPQSNGSIVLHVCRVDDSVIYKVATGEVVNDDVVTKTVDALMVDDGGAWRVFSTTVVARTPGIASCS